MYIIFQFWFFLAQFVRESDLSINPGSLMPDQMPPDWSNFGIFKAKICFVLLKIASAWLMPEKPKLTHYNHFFNKTDDQADSSSKKTYMLRECGNGYNRLKLQLLFIMGQLFEIIKNKTIFSVCYINCMKNKRPVTQFDWLSTPEPVKQNILKLEIQTNKNSQNSSKRLLLTVHTKSPKKRKKSKRKKGTQKGQYTCCGKTVKAGQINMKLAMACSWAPI